MIHDEPDLHTVFLLHEIESGLNPEVSAGLYERLWRPKTPTVAQGIILDRLNVAIGLQDCE